MKNTILFLIILASPSIAWSATAPVAQEARAQVIVDTNNQLLTQIGTPADTVLIKRIIISGFLLNDQERLKKIVKSNENKRLSQAQIQGIIDEIKGLYIQEGYANLVEIYHEIKKGRLVISVSMLNR